MEKWIGIDVSKAEFDVCIMDANKKVQHATFTNDKKGFRSVVNYLKKRKASGAPVCLEATGTYGEALAAYLHDRGYPVSVVNRPRELRLRQSHHTVVPDSAVLRKVIIEEMAKYVGGHGDRPRVYANTEIMVHLFPGSESWKTKKATARNHRLLCDL